MEVFFRVESLSLRRSAVVDDVCDVAKGGGGGGSDLDSLLSNLSGQMSGVDESNPSGTHRLLCFEFAWIVNVSLRRRRPWQVCEMQTSLLHCVVF